jgi:hypothetical protein
MMMHFGDVKESKIDTADEVNQWILTRLNETKEQVNQALDQYRFFEAAQLLYHFLWSEYCDWFIEFVNRDPVWVSIFVLRFGSVVLYCPWPKEIFSLFFLWIQMGKSRQGKAGTSQRLCSMPRQPAGY